MNRVARDIVKGLSRDFPPLYLLRLRGCAGWMDIANTNIKDESEREVTTSHDSDLILLANHLLASFGALLFLLGSRNVGSDSRTSISSPP